MVTKQQQLEWLAINYDEWPFSDAWVIMCPRSPMGFASRPGILITKKEWQQERDKMQKQAAQPAQDNSWHDRGEFPPVGSTVEKKYKSSDVWGEVKIVAAGNQLVIFGYPSGGEAFGEWSDYDFRPLRTEREKAIEEMVAVISSMSILSIERIAKKLYDSGYRKVNP